MHKNETSAALIIYDYDDVDALTSELGIKPSEAVNKNDSVNAHRSRWELQSSLSSTHPPEQHIQFLLEKLEPSKSKLSKLAQNYRVVMVLGIRFTESNPEIELDSMTISKLSDLGASLWLDEYFSYNTHLNSNEDIQKFAHKLSGLKAFNHNSNAAGEAYTFAKAISMLQTTAGEVNDNITNRFDDLISQESYEEEVEETLAKLQELSEAIKKLSYLRSKSND